MLTVVDLGVGNVGSLVSALRFLGTQHLVTSEPEGVQQASTLILPGVGSFPVAAGRLDSLSLRGPILERVECGRPLLGVCLGMQLLLETSEEGPGRGLGLIEGRCERLGRQSGVKVPHVGFDSVIYQVGSWLQEEMSDSADYYFTHSFAMRAPLTSNDGFCDYDGGFVAVVERWPIIGAQFHPEKSQTSGLRFLRAFLDRTQEAS